MVMPRVSQEVWDARARSVGLEWLEPVRGSGVKTLARCLAHGHERQVLPSNVKRAADRQQSSYCRDCCDLAKRVNADTCQTVHPDGRICGAKVVAKNKCDYHYRQDRYKDQQCHAEGCDRPLHRRGVCKTHYMILVNEGRLCSEEGCGNQAYLRGLCITHNKRFKAAGTQCSVNECTNPVASKGKCHNHYLRELYADDLCEIDDCDSPPISRGLCQTHYQLALNEGRICEIVGCDNRAKARGLCQHHYKLSLNEGTHCSVDGCDHPVSSKGMCFTHYNNERLAGITCSVDHCHGRAMVLNGGEPLCQVHVKRDRTWVVGESGGWDPMAPAVLYLIKDDDTWKFGVALERALQRRLKDHKWHQEVVDLMYGQGHEVMELETRIKQAIKRTGIHCILEERDGYTESHYRSELDPKSLAELLQLTQRR